MTNHERAIDELVSALRQLLEDGGPSSDLHRRGIAQNRARTVLAKYSRQAPRPPAGAQLCVHPRCHIMRDHTPDECGYPPEPLTRRLK